jgi:hypothetical protein
MTICECFKEKEGLVTGSVNTSVVGVAGEALSMISGDLTIVFNFNVADAGGVLSMMGVRGA